MEHEIIADNKKYISSRKAAKVTSYAQDYIGQLCRTEKVTARRVGKTWFVEEKSLLDYVSQQKIEKKKNAQNLKQTLRKQRNKNNNEVQASKNTADKNLSIDDKKFEKGEEFISNKVLIPFVGVLLFVAIIGFAFLLENDVIKRSNLASAVSPYNGLLGETSPQEDINVIEEDGILIADTVHILSELHGGLGLLFGGIEALQLMTENAPKGTRMAFAPIDEFGDVEGSYADTFTNNTQEGLVVIPSGGPEVDQEMVNYIQSSFSDDIIIKPNSDGGSGIIQPVFKDSVGKDYLYVIVPIRE